MNRYYKGFILEDATEPLVLTPTQADWDAAIPGNPAECVFAKFLHRTANTRYVEINRAINFIVASQRVIAKNDKAPCQNIPRSALGEHITRLPEKKQKKVIEQLTANGHSPTYREVRKAVDEELGITRKVTVSKELKQEFEKTGVCPVCGHVFNSK